MPPLITLSHIATDDAIQPWYALLFISHGAAGTGQSKYHVITRDALGEASDRIFLPITLVLRDPL